MLRRSAPQCGQYFGHSPSSSSSYSYGIDEYKDEEYDDEDDGLWPKYCPHCGALRRNTTIVKKLNPNTDELDGNVDEDEDNEN